jgi:hypothetical protein
MKSISRTTCLGSYDFASYLTGAAYDAERVRIEQHLSDCDFCFEVFIGAFNQYLDQGIMLDHDVKNLALELEYA